jgi:hypothetical protein
LVVPPTQLSAHALAEQTWPPEHAVPHPPQFDGSFVVSTQAVPHLVVPPLQTSWQALDTQDWPVGQTVPHPPQFARSLV